MKVRSPQLIRSSFSHLHGSGDSTTRGFTLLEVLISLSIVAIVFISLFRMQVATIRLADRQLFSITASRLALDKLAEITRDFTHARDGSGTFDGEFESYHWSCRISQDYISPDKEWISRDAAERLKRIDIEVTRGEESYEISAWRYFPDE